MNLTTAETDGQPHFTHQQRVNLLRAGRVAEYLDSLDFLKVVKLEDVVATAVVGDVEHEGEEDPLILGTVGDSEIRILEGAF